MTLITSAIGQGLLWALLGLGLYLSFRILNITDMTVEGTFPLGAAVAVTLIVHGVNPLLASLAATQLTCGSWASPTPPCSAKPPSFPTVS